MKKTVVIVVILTVIAYAVYYVVTPHYSFKYYYSKDKKQVLTAVYNFQLTNIAKETTYFTHGYYDQAKVPESYFQVLRDYQIVLHWQGDKCIVYAPDGVHKTKDLHQNVLTKESLTTEFWQKIRKDTTGEYIRLATD